MAAVATAIVPAISTGIETAEKAEREVERVEKRLHERSTEVFKRKLETYDFEKVFFNSAYGTGLFCVGWFSVKIGQFMIGLVDWLNSWGMPFTGWPGSLIPDEGMEQMARIGNVLNEIDAKFLVPYGPAMPATITGVAALSEYLRVRGFMPEQNRKISDAAVGLMGLGVLSVVSTGMSKPVLIKRNKDDYGDNSGGKKIIGEQEYFPPSPWKSVFHIFLLRLESHLRQVVVRASDGSTVWESAEWDENTDTQNVFQGQMFDEAKAWCLSQEKPPVGNDWNDEIERIYPYYRLEDRADSESRYILFNLRSGFSVMEWPSSFERNTVIMEAKAYCASHPI